MKEERALQVKRPGYGPPYGGERLEQPASDLPLFTDILQAGRDFVNGGCLGLAYTVFVLYTAFKDR
jgi:hypothetical protein